MSEPCVPEAVYAGVGKIVVAWATLEHNMALFTTLMVSPDVDTGISLTKELRFRSLADAMINVARSHIGEGPDLDTLSSIVKRAESLELSRNKFAHSVLLPTESDPSTAALWKITAKRRGIKRLAEKVTAADLEKIAEEIKGTQKALMQLLQQLANSGRLKYVRN